MNLYEGVAKYYDIEESEYQQEDMDFYIEYGEMNIIRYYQRLQHRFIPEMILTITAL